VPLALEAHQLSKRFGETHAVDSVDLQLRPGEVRGLLGPNGAGKTTLLRMLMGLVEPDAGSAQLLGHSLSELGTRALYGVGGFVEEPRFYPYLSARQNLELLSRLDGRTKGAHAVTSALTRVGLGDRSRDRVSSFSTGMRQRLGIAAALIRSPQLLLLDEPTSGLDPGGARAVAELVNELSAEGVAILLSSHQIGELERICTHYSMMRSGRLVWSGTVSELERQAPPSAYTLHTSDDALALNLAAEHRDHLVVDRAARDGLSVLARPEALDALVADLGAARVLIRRLEWRISPLESMYYAQTEDRPAEPEPSPATEPAPVQG
jgi:ABC-2 type transport system ATP-binding protein